MNRRLASGELGRSEVLRRAAVAIAEHGYHGMSMRALAKSTGRGLASVYHLFRSKEDILFELQHSALRELCATAEVNLTLATGTTDAEAATARLRRFVENHVRFVLAEPDLMRVLVQEASALPSEGRAIIRGLKQRYFDLGARLLGGVVAQAGGAPDPSEVERSAYCMFGMLNWIFAWYDPELHGTPVELAQTILRVITSGAAGGMK